jgi:hypothetical protein
MQLMKGERCDKESFVWYERGIRENLPLTKLYENYMMSMDIRREQEILKNALMYFSYQCALPGEYTEYLYHYVVHVWHKYFPSYHYKYGIPFIACYDASIQDFENGTAYHNPVRDRDGSYLFSIISIIDKTHKKGFNAAEAVRKAVYEEDWDNQYANELIAHELCHVIMSMEMTEEEEELFSDHYNSVFLREANRLLLDYDLDVHVY